MSRWIDAEWLIAELKTVADRPIQSQLYIVRQAPSIDIVRCKECKYAHMTYGGDCKYCDKWVDDDDGCIEVYHDGDHFCSYGERK